MGLEEWGIVATITGVVFAVYFGFKQLRKPPTPPAVQVNASGDGAAAANANNSSTITQHSHNSGISDENLKVIITTLRETQQYLFGEIDRLKGEAADNAEAQQQLTTAAKQLAAIQEKLTNKDVLIAKLQHRHKAAQQKIAELRAQGTDPATAAAAVLEQLAKDGWQAAQRAYADMLNNTTQHTDATAIVAYQMGQYANTLVQYEQALRYFEEAVRLAPENGVYVNALALMLQTLGRYADAQPRFENALQLAQHGSDQHTIATASNNLASLYRAQGKYDLAEALYQQALAIDEQVLDTNHRDTATAYNNLAGLYRTQGKYEQAEALYKKALTIDEQVLDTNHRDTATAYNNLAGLYYQQGKYDLAEPLYNKAIAIGEQTLDKSHPDLATRYNNLAVLYEAQRKYDAAEALYVKAIPIFEAAFGADHYYTTATKASYQRMLADKAGRQSGGE